MQTVSKTYGAADTEAQTPAAAPEKTPLSRAKVAGKIFTPARAWLVQMVQKALLDILVRKAARMIARSRWQLVSREARRATPPRSRLLPTTPPYRPPLDSSRRVM